MAQIFEYTWKRTFPRSSNIDTMYYNNKDNRLVVKFNSGSKAGYERVPGTVVDSVVENASVGAAYNLLIRGEFKGFSVDPDTEFLDAYRRRNDFFSASKDDNRTFKIVAQVTVEREVSAKTLDEALAKFNKDNPGAVVKSASVEF